MNGISQDKLYPVFTFKFYQGNKNETEKTWNRNENGIYGIQKTKQFE